MNKQKNRLISGFIAIILMTMAASASATTGDPAGEEIPKGLWQAFHDARHQVEPVQNEQAEQTFRASNYGNGFSMQFNSQGLTLQQRVQDNPWQLTMQLVAYGQPQAIHSLCKRQACKLMADASHITVAISASGISTAIWPGAGVYPGQPA